MNLGEVQCACCSRKMLVNMEVWNTFTHPLPFCDDCEKAPEGVIVTIVSIKTEMIRMAAAIKALTEALS